jgi:hypothetical protein
MTLRKQDTGNRIVRRDGQSRNRRMGPALAPESVLIDGRSLAELYDFTHDYAREVVFHQAQDALADADWQPFFQALPAGLAQALDYANDQAAALEALGADGELEPHQALFLAFLRLYRHARTGINGLTKAHLDFYFRRILGFRPKPAEPDRVHVLFELKKRITSHFLAAGTVLTAGKDATGAPLNYRLTSDLMVYPAKIESLRSLFLNAGGRETLHAAPMADSLDGLGEPLDKAAPRFMPFGHAGLPPAEIGFALCAPLLRLGQGGRTIHADLTLAGATDVHTLLADAFEAFLTGEKGWLGPFTVETSTLQGRCRLTVNLTAAEGAVVDFDDKVHGGGFAADGPVLQFKLKAGSAVDYGPLKAITLRRCRLVVDVTGIAAPSLAGDLGALDGAKPFMPFGPEPKPGARLHIGLGEAADKQIDKLVLHLTWQNAPRDFSSTYNISGYRVAGNSHFKVDIAAPLDEGEQTFGSVSLFDADDASAQHAITLPPAGQSARIKGRSTGAARRQQWLMRQDSRWARKRVREIRQTNRTHALGVSSSRQKKLQAVLHPEMTHRAGHITLRLKSGFLHAEYRRLYTSNVAAIAGGATDVSLPNEPYTPVVASLTLDYTAATDTIDITGSAPEDFLNGQLLFFQMTAFGQRCDHAFVRAQLPFVRSGTVHLLPRHNNEGEFYIGVSGVAPRQSIPLLFQVVEGTANPSKAKQKIQWSILADNHWRDLGSEEIITDTTNQLLTSGIITFAIPDEATDTNTLMPSGLHWLRGTVAADTDAVCQLSAVHPNAAIAAFTDRGNDPAHLAAPLPAGTVTGFAAPPAAVKAVTQPYASFGGRMTETDHQLYTRGAERLRHKQRAVAGWDYERLVLERFPAVHKVKCLSHTAPDSLVAPGHVTLVVIPRLVHQTAVDPLQPRVDLNTLDEIERYLRGLCGPDIRLHVQNPDYETVRCVFAVQLHAAQAAEFGRYRRVLEEEIQSALSPWAFDDGADIAFGGRIFASALLQFVEDRPYVDYVTDFNLYMGSSAEPVQTAAAADPRAILVSAAAHDIRKTET